MKFLGVVFLLALGSPALAVESVSATPLVSVQSMDGVLLFARGTWAAQLHWMKGPVVGEESVLRVDWSRADHTPVEAPGDFVVALWMPDMQHGSAPTSIQRILDGSGHVVTGAYEVTNVDFFMAGKWEVRVTLTVNGHAETETLPMTISGMQSD